MIQVPGRWTELALVMRPQQVQAPQQQVEVELPLPSLKRQQQPLQC